MFVSLEELVKVKKYSEQLVEEPKQHSLWK